MEMTITRKVDELGRVVLPAEYRNAMGIASGSDISMIYANESIIIKLCLPICKICHSQQDVDSELKVCKNCISMIKNS